MHLKKITIQKVNPATFSEFNVLELNFENSFIELKKWITQTQTPYLIHFMHNELTTLIDVTGVMPYEIWYLNDKLELTSKSFSLHNGSGSFRIQTQAKKVLLINLNSLELINKF